MHPFLKRVSIGALLCAATLAATSRVVVASTNRSTYDRCFVDCGAGGACSAESGWWEIWEDCECHCMSSGGATCGCD